MSQTKAVNCAKSPQGQRSLHTARDPRSSQVEEGLVINGRTYDRDGQASLSLAKSAVGACWMLRKEKLQLRPAESCQSWRNFLNSCTREVKEDCAN